MPSSVNTNTKRFDKVKTAQYMLLDRPDSLDVRNTRTNLNNILKKQKDKTNSHEMGLG
jgi:hypothetical protein